MGLRENVLLDAQWLRFSILELMKDGISEHVLQGLRSHVFLLEGFRITETSFLERIMREGLQITDVNMYTGRIDTLRNQFITFLCVRQVELARGSFDKLKEELRVFKLAMEDRRARRS